MPDARQTRGSRLVRAASAARTVDGATLPPNLRPLPMLADRIVPLIVAVSLFMENMDSTVIATSLPAIAEDVVEFLFYEAEELGHGR